MYVDTVFGIKWRDAVSSTEIYMVILVIILAIAAYSLYKYNLKLNEKILHARLLFQFKIKQYGLTGLQRRIVNHIIETRKLKNPQIIFKNPDIFEESIGDILSYFKSGSEAGESFVNICKDIILTYEKLYHHAFARKPIEKIFDVEEGILLYFYLNPSAVYVGKLIEKNDSQMTLQLFRDIKYLPEIEIDAVYEFFLWRAGDAEYLFKAKAVSHENGRVVIEMPSEFTRGKEVRRPYIDVFIACTLSLPGELKTDVDEETESITGTVIKLNEHELVIRLEQKLDYLIKYIVNFKIDEFKVSTSVQLIADKTISEGDTHYYTCKMIEISEAAKIVLHKLINDSF
jgi:hypothetical protein